MSNSKTLIQQAIADNNLVEALQLFRLALPETHFALSELTNLSGTLASADRDLRNNLIGHEEHRRVVSRVNYALLQLLREVNFDVAVTPLYYNLPLRPNFFVGRNDDLTALHAALTEINQPKKVVLLSGLGGIGKTALMQEYLHQALCREHFERIVSISVQRNLRTAFIFGVAEAFGLDMKAHPRDDDQLNLVVRTLRACTGANLIAIDNINESDKDDLIAFGDVFAATGWVFLITSRATPDDFTSVRVGELLTDQAVALFNYHYAPNSAGRRAVALLVNRVHRHTLLTELLAKVARKKGYSPTYMLDLLEQADFRQSDLQRTITIGAHARSTFRTELNQTTIHQYLLNLFEPELMDDDSQTLLRFFSLLPSDDMPIEDLKILWRVEPPGENTFEDQLDDLQQSGWLLSKYKRQDTLASQNLTFKMHPLVKEVVYEKLRPNIHNCRPLVRTLTEILGLTLPHALRFQSYAKSILSRLTYVADKTS